MDAAAVVIYIPLLIMYVMYYRFVLFYHLVRERDHKHLVMLSRMHAFTMFLRLSENAARRSKNRKIHRFIRHMIRSRRREGDGSTLGICELNGDD